MPVEITPNGFRTQRRDDGIWFYEPVHGRWNGPENTSHRYLNESNHVFTNRKYWHVPAVVMRFKDVGLQLRESSLGCGTKQLYDFKFDTSDTKAVADMFELELKPYRQGITGIILAVLNPTQNPVYGPILLAAGFELLSKHTNYMHNHPNYLYGFKCMDNKATIDEKERAFG